MTESEYLRKVAQVLEDVQDAIERAQIDADCALSGMVLNIDLDEGDRIVLNAQAPTRQLWLAARTGAMHFAHDGQVWADLRSGEEFYAALSRVVSGLIGRSVVLRPA